MTSDSAKKRWTTTRFARSAIFGHLMENADLRPAPDVCTELQAHIIVRDNEQLTALIDTIENTMNPFTQCNHKLQCISTAKTLEADLEEKLV